MLRDIAAAAIIVCVCSWPAPAQDATFRVTADSAEVHKGPSTVTPVIGHAPRGAVLAVQRNLGSWVKVPWPAGDDGVGYVHVSMGSIRSGSVAAASAMRPTPAPAGSHSSSADYVPPQVPLTPAPGAAATDAPRVPRSVYVTPSPHFVGLGARVGGPTMAYGAAARGWGRRPVGAQLNVSRSIFDGVAATGRVTSLQFEPSVLYRLHDTVGDYVWLRPYVGSGLIFGRQTLSSTTASASVDHNQVAAQLFGGGELTFASIPRFTLSADGGYRWAGEPFAGVDQRGAVVSLSGHWYVR